MSEPISPNNNDSSDRAQNTQPSQDSKSADEPKGLTPGQRLAAKKQAKAHKKSKDRGRIISEEEVIKKASHVGRWLTSHKAVLLSIVGGVLAVVGATAAFVLYQQNKDEAAAQGLVRMIRVVEARVDTDNTDPNLPEQPDNTLRFATHEKKQQALVKRASEVIRSHQSTDAAMWAHLSRGAAYLQSGKYAEAAKDYQAVIQQGGSDDLTFAPLAFEGLIIAYEQQGRHEQALSKAEALSKLDQGKLQDLADYHKGRILAHQGKTEQAKTVLAKLVKRLMESKEENKSEFLQAQAELKLVQLDNTHELSPVAKRAADGGGVGSMDPARLQELLRQLQNK